MLAVANARMKTVKKTASKRVPAPTKLVLPLLGNHSKTDVDGSYTGVPLHEEDNPVQDADDL